MQTLELFPPGRALPCVQAGPDLYFSESPRELELAKQLCRPCPLRTRCLEGAPSPSSGPGDVPASTRCPRSRPSCRPPRPRPADEPASERR
jgi:WhiB family transcriptional regulator, redox-sensing transcriptional regulator